jgi:uncharacterized protein YdbL (DUF1318 family)
MKFTRRKFFPVTLFFCLALGACVTINIYFPAEEVEAMAGEIVHDIRGNEEIEKPSGKDQSFLWESIFFAFSPASAWAEEATEVSNATIRALKQKMKARFVEMKPYYNKGTLTEGKDGYVKVASLEGLGLKEKRDVKALADAENKDRRQLYREVARALKIDENEMDRVAEIFAVEWRKSVR